MSEFKLHTLGCPVIRDTAEALALAPSLLKEVDEIWEHAQAGRAKPMFNGTLFSVSNISSHEISGRFVGYKFFIAQRRRPELFDALRIQPLAVTGIMEISGHIAFGKRAQNVTQEPGLWELIPSGGLDDTCCTENGGVDASRQLLQELREEINIEEEAVSNVTPFCVVEDTLQHVFDIAIAFEVRLTLDELRTRFQASGNDEYDGIRALPKHMTKAFVSDADTGVAPFSRYVIELLETKGQLI